MYAMVYPIHLQKRSERRWANRIAREIPIRRSRPEGTDSCACGNVVTAPVSSQYAPYVVTNEWHCTKCDTRWTTEAPANASRPLIRPSRREIA
ncbi:hypothetical protein GGQ85_003074 [Nitrobacter vulgaris]|jgi:hypothetical protein|uniref:Uncharacterized protein n=1 Tax=Nitrobacter vulgaris TaxID=29421 RepID=A0A1V4I0T9_NITVU|nr:hypothetical protein [Nitrobacter vulgaris]OPH83846.1 hypothetical protein B2M20_04885 [Nitrobacter vulgaris]